MAAKTDHRELDSCELIPRVFVALTIRDQLAEAFALSSIYEEKISSLSLLSGLSAFQNEF